MRDYQDIQQDLDRIEPKADAKLRLEQALAACAFAPRLPGPDYQSFKAWIFPQLADEQQLVRKDPTHSISTTLIAAVLFRFVALSGDLRKRAETGLDIAALNKLKLLLSVLRTNERAQQLADALIAQEPREDLTENLEDVSPAELRIRLFTAMGAERSQDAAYIMGHLRRDTLDMGEHDFLHALSRFESGDLPNAIRLCERVPESSIDGPRAVYIAAKAHAILGDTSNARATIERTNAKFTTCQWLHLLELAAYNAGTSQALAMVNGLMPESPLVIDPSDNSYSEWAAYHVRVVVGAIERLNEVVEAHDATSKEIQSDELVESDPILKRAQIALSLAASRSSDQNISDGTELLVPLINGGDQAAFRIWCEMKFRLADYKLLVDQFEPIWSKGGDARGEIDLVALICQAALLCEHPLAGELMAQLERADGSVADRVSKAAEREHLLEGFTTMGRMSYRDACRSLVHAADDASLWRDCSLIALGFFRVIEIELNDKLVRPIAQNLDFAALTAEASLLPESRSHGWKQRLKRLQATVADKSRGLMLGQISDLLSSGTPSGISNESTLRNFLRQEICTLLTPEGRTAFENGSLAAVIGSNVQRFRNPPAHGAFLSLRDAQECEAVVTTSLINFRRWFTALA